MPSDDAFSDVLAANATYADALDGGALEARAARGLGVVTCMDSRIDPLAMLGLGRGDAKVLRNAGGRVTDDVLGALVAARWLLGVRRVMVIPHTGCRMACPSPDAVHAAIAQAGGPDTRSIPFLTAADPESALADDVERLRSSPYLDDVTVGGFVYDVATGRLRRVC